MRRVGLTTYLMLVIAAYGSGCTTMMVTTRVIDTFSENLAKKDLTGLRAVTSTGFEEKALRNENSAQDLQILNLPNGKATVVETKDDSETERLVTVEVGEKKQKLIYKLTKEPKSGDWVVDDILMKQKRRGQNEVTRSVTEQMHFLLSVREILNTWKEGRREDILKVTTPKFREALAGVPPRHLQKLVSEISGEGAPSNGYKPQAEINEDSAVVVIQRAKGQLVLDLRSVDGQWLLDDAELKNSENSDAIGSTYQRSLALSAAGRFLEAYATRNRTQLQELTSPGFYKNSLAVADFETAPFNATAILSADFDFRLQSGEANLIVESPQGLQQITLKRQDSEEDGKTKYLVSEITVYDGEGGNAKRLSALFTAHAVMNLFAEALPSRNIPLLKQTSTMEFQELAWNLVDDAVVHQLPLHQFEQVKPRVVSTVFRGPVTEISVVQGPRAYTYVLRDVRGKMLVDDVIMPATDRPSSLKENLAMVIPALALANAYQLRNLDSIKQVSSKKLNYIVWRMADRVPDVQTDLVNMMMAPVTSVRLRDNSAEVTFGRDSTATRVFLVKEDGRYRVDDVMIASDTPHHQLSFRETARQCLIYRISQRSEQLRMQARNDEPASISEQAKTSRGPVVEFPQQGAAAAVIPAASESSQSIDNALSLESADGESVIRDEMVRPADYETTLPPEP